MSVVIGLRVDHRNPSHTTVSVFTGEQRGAVAHSGIVTFRTKDWEELVAQPGPVGELTLDVVLLTPLAPVPPPTERRSIRGG